MRLSFHDKDVLFFIQHVRHSWAAIPHDKVWAFVSIEGNKYQDGPLTVDYELSLPDVLATIYRKRLVSYDEALSYAEWKRHLPESHMVIDSLRLNESQHMEALRAVTHQAEHATSEIHRQRWKHILTQLKFAVEELWQRERKLNASGDASFNRD